MRAMKDSGVEWIGKIPSDWETKKFKFYFWIIGGCGFKDEFQGKENGDYPFCKASDINGSSKFVSCAKNYVDRELVEQQRYSVIPESSIIIAKIGEALKKNHRKINTVPCVVDNNCEAFVARYQDNIDYLYYILTQIDMNWFDNGGTVPSVNNEKLRNFKLPFIMIGEQSRIAAFLDAKCAQIDAIIENHQQVIEKLKAYKQSMITEAVTKGLDPKATMKDSGAQWIGSMPINWSVRKFKFFFTIIGGSGFKEDYQGKDNGDYPFCKASDINGIAKTVSTAKNYVDEELVLSEGYTVVPMHSLLIAKIGEALKKNHRKINSVPCIVDNNCEAFALRGNDDINYLYYVLTQVDMTWFDNGGTVPSVNNEKLRNFKLPYPPADVQRNIATFLDGECIKIDMIMEKRQGIIDLLTDYKKSLIYEAVTGKMEV